MSLISGTGTGISESFDENSLTSTSQENINFCIRDVLHLSQVYSSLEGYF